LSNQRIDFVFADHQKYTRIRHISKLIDYKSQLLIKNIMISIQFIWIISSAYDAYGRWPLCDVDVVLGRT